MLPWGSIIKFTHESTKPVYLQIAESIIKTIHDGQLAPGHKLPGTRVFSSILNLNRKTISAAIDELNSQGWVECSPKRGTFVARNLPVVDFKSLKGQDVTSNELMDTHQVNHLPFLEELHLDGNNKILIDDGVPDIRLSPLKALFGYQRSILSKNTFNGLLTYNHVEGDIGLRTTLSDYLHNTRGIFSNPGNIFITRGSQMGIYIITSSLVQSGDNCVTGFPGYSMVDNIIKHLKGNILHVPVDDQGIVTRKVEKICKAKSVKLIYTTPHHHYPTTVTLSPQRRIELLQLSRKYGFYIIEDDYDYDFHYSNKPVLPLASVDKIGRVIYIGSFSKSLSPSVRIGYFIAKAPVMEAANKLRRIIDRQGDPLLERALGLFIKSGELQRHMKKVVKIYKQRRDYFCSQLEEYLSDHITYNVPEGGMAVYVTFKNHGILGKMSEKLYNAGYVIDSDDLFTTKCNSLRIGFASMDSSKADKFIISLKRIMDTD